MYKLCPPALIYLVFSVTQIIIDTFKGLYNTAFFKFIVMIMFTLLLNALCQQGLGVISWIIVFIPFMLMTVIVTMLLYIFGLNVSTGNFNYTCMNPPTYNTPNKIVVVDTNNPNQYNSKLSTTTVAPSFSSSPAYESFIGAY